jgi:amidase
MPFAKTTESDGVLVPDLPRMVPAGAAPARSGESPSSPEVIYVPLTALQNITCQQAISLPLAWSKAFLPTGIQFVGRFGEEHLLLELAAQIEKAEPWNRKRPPVYG